MTKFLKWRVPMVDAGFMRQDGRQFDSAARNQINEP